MEIFKEQIVRKLPDKNDQIKKVLIIVATLVVALLCFLLLFGTVWGFMGIVLAGLAVYGGYYLLTGLMVEYEYIITNGEIDIDKITAQRSRKRLATVKLSTATEFGEANDSLNIGENVTFIKADANDPAQTNYYIRLNHSTFGETVLLFTPNEEMLELVKESLPRNLRFRR